MAIVIRRTTADDLLDLRRVALRDGRTDLSASLDADEDPTTIHLAAFDDSNGEEVIGCLTLIADRYPDDTIACATRIALMAVADAHRGEGLGFRLIDAAKDLEPNGLWARARVTALPFYERLGFVVTSDEFVGAMDLPHRLVLWTPRP